MFCWIQDEFVYFELTPSCQLCLLFQTCSFQHYCVHKQFYIVLLCVLYQLLNIPLYATLQTFSTLFTLSSFVSSFQHTNSASSSNFVLLSSFASAFQLAKPAISFIFVSFVNIVSMYYPTLFSLLNVVTFFK